MEPTVHSDAELVAETLAGDREAFGQLYDRYARMVRAVVVAVAGEWSVVEDMTQESFLRAYRKLATLREPQQFGPWIVGIARYVARERRRSIHRDRHEYGYPTENASTTDGLAAVHDRDQLERVLRELAQLPEQERLAIHTFYLERQDTGHAAQLLELSRSGYYAVVQRAVAKLAARLRAAPKNETVGH